MVITACDATGAAMICRFVFTILSKIGMMKKMPGPLAPMERPSRKITARSYSCTILIELARMMTMNTATTISTPRIASTHAPFI